MRAPSPSSRGTEPMPAVTERELMRALVDAGLAPLDEYLRDYGRDVTPKATPDPHGCGAMAEACR